MNGKSFTAAQAFKLLEQLTASESNTVEIEGAIAKLRYELDAKIVGVVLDPTTNKAERTPKASTTHAELQKNNTYFTAIIVRNMGMTAKPFHKAIYRNSAPILFDAIKASVEAMEANNGVFAEISLEGSPVKVYDMEIEKGFYIANKATKSGYSEDKMGRPVLNHNRALIVMEDFENIQTVMRRDLRNLEYDGMMAGIAQEANLPAQVNNTPAAPKTTTTPPPITYEQLIEGGWTPEQIAASDDYKHLKKAV